MEDNINEGIHPDYGREDDAISDQGNGGKVTLDYIESDNTDTESKSQKRNRKKSSAKIDYPRSAVVVMHAVVVIIQQTETVQCHITCKVIMINQMKTIL